MKWTNDKIVKWHKEVFPKCKMSSMLLKLEEEVNEYQDAFDNRDYESAVLELADVYIVAVVLWKRYNSIIGGHFIEEIEDNLGPSRSTLYDTIDKKMAINVDRTFERVGSVYRHTNPSIKAE